MVSDRQRSFVVTGILFDSSASFNNAHKIRRCPDLSAEIPPQAANVDDAQLGRLFKRFDILTLFGAIVALFLVSGSEPWWTLAGTTTSRLFNIEVSPFFLHMVATGLPATAPAASFLGSFTRTFLLAGFVALFAAGIRPTAWWRNLAICFGLSSLAELYLSFLLMFYWAETAFVNTYGVVPPYLGTAVLQATVVGLDLGYYPSPLVTATFNIAFFLGFVSVGLLLGRTTIRILHERAFQVLAALLPGGVGIHDIRLSPPYQQVWFSTEDLQYNPMWKYLGGVGDDQLLISFEKLFETVEPSGSLAVILPEGSTILSDKLGKLMPEIGFVFEEIRAISSAQGKPEVEMRFRRPTTEQLPTIEAGSPEPATILQPLATEPTTPSSGIEESTSVVSPAEEPSDTIRVPSEQETPPASPPVLEVVSQPPRQGQKITRLERIMLKSAIRAINEHRQPFAYRELLNEVYMDLVDHKVEFDSARQIETTLLNHNGQEVVLLGESDFLEGRAVKKWGLGPQKLRSERSRSIPGLKRVKAVTPKIASIRKIIARPRKPRYVAKPDTDYDSSSESSGG